MLRQPRDRKDPKAIDESTDTYDTIDWLLKNVPSNNGRVGMLGIELPGWLDGHGRARSASGAQGHRRRRPRPPTCGSATTSITTARSA